MNILVIGGCQVYGYGLALDQRSFIDQFVSQLKDIGYWPQVTSYVFLPLADIRETLAHLDLSQFDLLIIQPAHYYLQHPTSFWKLFKTPTQKKTAKPGIGLHKAELNALRDQPTLPLDRTAASRVKQTKNQLKRLLLTVSKPIGLVKQLLYVQQEIGALLEQLHYHRQRVIILTPTPHREPVSQWLRKQGRTTIINEGERWGITVLDTHSIIRPHKEVYVTDDPSHLNSIGHKLLGQALFTCYKPKHVLQTWAEKRTKLVMEAS